MGGLEVEGGWRLCLEERGRMALLRSKSIERQAYLAEGSGQERAEKLGQEMTLRTASAAGDCAENPCQDIEEAKIRDVETCSQSEIGEVRQQRCLVAAMRTSYESALTRTSLGG